MEKVFNIGQIAEFFQIPPSTLRYWEETGILIPKKNRENNYREYSISDLLTISDILFYKNLGLPLKQIGTMTENTAEVHQKMLEEKAQVLEKQKKEIDQRIQKLQYHLTAIQSVQQLKAEPFAITDIDTDCIVPFELLENEKLRQYIENPYLFSWVQHSDNPNEEHRGLAISKDQSKSLLDSQKLWQKQGSKYVVCLMQEEMVPGFPSNLLELLANVQEKYQTGFIIRRFLLQAQEGGKLFDFYKTYIEIF